VSAALIAPLAFVMGMPFPTGLRQLGERAPAMVPWAWGMNGVFSVLGSVVVILISMLSSFTVALVCGALCYASAMLVCAALWQIHPAWLDVKQSEPLRPAAAKSGVS